MMMMYWSNREIFAKTLKFDFYARLTYMQQFVVYKFLTQWKINEINRYFFSKDIL